MAFDPRFTRWRALFLPQFWRARYQAIVNYWPIGRWKQLQPKPKPQISRALSVPQRRRRILTLLGRRFTASDAAAAAFSESATLSVHLNLSASDTNAVAFSETATFRGTTFGAASSVACAFSEAASLTIKNPTDASSAGLAPIDCVSGPGGEPTIPGVSGSGGIQNYVF